MTNLEIVYKILDVLGVEYAKSLPAQCSRAIDIHRTSLYEVTRFVDIIPEDFIIDLYNRLIWNFVWAGGPITNGDWGIDGDKPLPLIIKNPLTQSVIKYTYNGITLSPSNATIISDSRFCDCCRTIYNILQSNADTIVEVIMQLDATVEQRNLMLDAFLNARNILSQI